MNVLELAQKNGREYKRVSSIHGGEYHGPCPGCGGNDRFHIWPDQGDNGSWWCRKCDKGGDAIQYLRDMEGLDFRSACAALGVKVEDQQEYQSPRINRPAAAQNFTPRETTAASDLWIEHATKLVDWAHQQLLGNPDQLRWLAARGLDGEAVVKYRLGWNSGEKGKDLYRAREAWGLETVLKDDGKKKKLWLPVGLTIPYYIDGTLQRVRIRRPEGEPRYYLVPGSNMAPMVLNPQAKAFVVVESELDALLIHHLAGDITGAISQGNSTAKPDSSAAAALEQSLSILVALDSDDAGMLASVWWKKNYPQAERWPVPPPAKDPGEAYSAGIDLRAWVLAGLPPVFGIKAAAPAAALRPSPQDNSGAVVPAAAPESEQPERQPARCITARDGRQVYITDCRDEYRQLVAAGKIVFDSREIALVETSGATKEESALFLDVKQMFPGARMTDPLIVAPPAEPKTYRGKFYPHAK